MEPRQMELDVALERARSGHGTTWTAWGRRLIAAFTRRARASSAVEPHTITRTAPARDRGRDVAPRQPRGRGGQRGRWGPQAPSPIRPHSSAQARARAPPTEVTRAELEPAG